MNSSNLTISNKSKERPSLLVLCLFFSVLLHLLMVFYLRYHLQEKEDQLAMLQEPTIVRLVDKTEKQKPKEMELDQRPAQPAAEPPVESSRLAEDNQKVEKEMAPKGDDVRDQAASPAAAQPVAPPPVKESASTSKPQQPQPVASPEAPKPLETVEQARKQLPETEPEQPQQEAVQPAAPLPPLQQLTQLAPRTLNRIATAEQERIKQRDVEQGDTVWLNLEQGSLISFFRRFRTKIEGVWNYPREAIDKQMQGILLLKITINREGEVIHIDLVQSSGHEILDMEAILAVNEAQPFGPVGKHYPHPEMKIMAHFIYTISGKFIYGQKR